MKPSLRSFSKPHLLLITLVGVIVPRRLRADWRHEWEAELRSREALLTRWDRLDWRMKLDLLRRSLGAFRDALLLQPRRLEDEMFQDVRFGVRMLLKKPGFTLVAVFTLALGIGATTTMYSVVYNVLIDPFTYADADRIEDLLIQDLENPRGGERGALPVAEFLDYQEQSRVFEEVIGSVRETIL